MTIQTLVDALALGSLFALFALPIALLFGIMRLVNFAHGELVMIGALTLTFLQDASPVVRVLAAVLVPTLAALLMDRVVFRPFRTASATTLLIVSFGVSFFIKSLAMLAVGTVPRSANVAANLTMTVDVLGARVSLLAVVTTTVTVGVLVALTTLLYRTSLGIQLRAAAEDFEASRILGVDADRVVLAAFVVSGLLAGTSAILIMAQTGSFSVEMGLTPVLYGFIAAVVGGMGNLRGAVLGAYMIAIVSTVLQVVLPTDVLRFRDAAVFGAVLLLMAVRPNGLLAVRGREVRV